VCGLTFSLFFAQNLGAQIEALESFTKREIPQFAQINLGAQIEALESFTKREIPQRYKI